MCEHCNEEYTSFNLEEVIDGKHQNLEAYIIDDCELECYTLYVTGDTFNFSIKIKFCPICGRQL